MSNHNVGIALLPQVDMAIEIRMRQSEISRKYNTVQGLLQPPHVTIKRPFIVDNISKIKNFCELLAKNNSAIHAIYEKYGFIGNKIICLKLKKNKRIENLHKKIIKNLCKIYGAKIIDNMEGEQMKFHTTLAYGDLSETQCKLAQKNMKNFKSNSSMFELNQIALLRSVGDEWVIESKFRLKNE